MYSKTAQNVQVFCQCKMPSSNAMMFTSEDQVQGRQVKPYKQRVRIIERSEGCLKGVWEGSEMSLRTPGTAQTRIRLFSDTPQTSLQQYRPPSIPRRCNALPFHRSLQHDLRHHNVSVRSLQHDVRAAVHFHRSPRANALQFCFAISGTTLVTLKPLRNHSKATQFCFTGSAQAPCR